MTNPLKNKKKIVKDTYSRHYHIVPDQKKTSASKTASSLKTAHSFVLSLFSFLSLSLKNNHNSLISISRLPFFSLSPSLSLSSIYLFNQSSLLLLLGENDQVVHHKTKIIHMK
jgi:hypothetical protein